MARNGASPCQRIRIEIYRAVQQLDERASRVIRQIERHNLDMGLGHTIRHAMLSALLLSMLAGCAAGSAMVGPDLGGGFYCPHNAFKSWAQFVSRR